MSRNLVGRSSRFTWGHPFWAACRLTPCKGASGQGGRVRGFERRFEHGRCKNIMPGDYMEITRNGGWSFEHDLIFGRPRGFLGVWFQVSWVKLDAAPSKMQSKWSNHNHRKEPTCVGTWVSNSSLINWFYLFEVSFSFIVDVHWL